MGILNVDNITMKFGGLVAVSEFNMELKEGEIVGLIGPNGAGKTTAFNMITGVYKPTIGNIYLEKDNKNINITSLKPDEITRLGVARTFQNIRLFKELTVLENVLIGNHLRLKSNWAESVVGPLLKDTFNIDSKYTKEEKHMYEKSIELLKEVNLYDVIDEKAYSLPYGKQRRLEIARALATEPKILLLDEPAAGMNPNESLELMDFISEIRDKFNSTIFMIEHHMQVVMGICERIFVLDHGITIAQGTPSEIQNNNKVIEAYLGVE
ncbi:ABC transporter ATP-binding protein [Anaeromicrobium sediminis]|uniref:High-affinity branched-chain amino acid ABC transporter ATP-binding protein LivG n=1 Tax=Anaeromicrobium sediminis TaxID=1478221 RepID=A0A267MHL1_9FIRM|nr:ABC transporter ATP-binding protein [Anaeromicrobium sediminis]PAB58418.1 high-affinity branched-chain amino acid ABC transporter ATP-binding protein LivG [Anaeromicrobium sediminis]